MQTETVPVAGLRPPERNVRSHPEYQVKEMARAVEMFGQTRPVVIDEENTVLVGNGLVDAFKHLGRVEIAAYRISGLSPTAKQKLMLSDNQIFELGLDDHQAILELIHSLDGDFNIPGFDPEALAADREATFAQLNNGAGHARTRRRAEPGAAPQEEEEKRGLQCPHCGHAFSR